MAKKFTQYLIAIALLVGGGTIFASTALASDVPQTAADLPPSIMMVWSGSDSAVSASDVANKNVVFLSNIMANGLSKKTVRRAKEHGGCRWIGAGTDVPGYWNSGRDANGVLFWFWDTRLVYECNGRKVLCGNFVRFQRPKHNVITHGRVIMVRSFAHLVVRIHLVAEARASCPDNPGTWARGSASLTQKVELRMFVKTKGRSTVRLYGKLVDRAGVKAQARVHCETAVAIIISQPPVPPECSCAPPPVKPTPPTVKNVTQPQEVYVNETYPSNICADVSAPAGHNVKVVFSAKFGSFPDSTFNYSGGFARPCKTYHGPGDVTPTGHDVITVTVYDITTSLTDSASSDPFEILRSPANP
jgi:hypothetical protein